MKEREREISTKPMIHIVRVLRFSSLASCPYTAACRDGFSSLRFASVGYAAQAVVATAKPSAAYCSRVDTVTSHQAFNGREVSRKYSKSTGFNTYSCWVRAIVVFLYSPIQRRREGERVVTVPFLLRWKLTIVWVSSCIFKKRYAARSCTT